MLHSSLLSVFVAHRETGDSSGGRATELGFHLASSSRSTRPFAVPYKSAHVYEMTKDFYETFMSHEVIKAPLDSKSVSRSKLACKDTCTCKH